MIAKVDADVCIGCGLCEQTAPSVFEMQGDKAVVKTNPVPSGDEQSARDAADICPVTAIAVQ